MKRPDKQPDLNQFRSRLWRASCTKAAPIRIRSEPIPQLILGLIYLLLVTRFIWPLELPLSIKIVAAVLALVALQFHRWSKLSSGSVFSPEFPRPVVILFNWAFGGIVLLVLLQLLLDGGLLFGLLIHGGIVSAPDGVRYALAALAAVAAAIGVHQAMRIPPLKGYRSRYPRTSATILRLHRSPIDRSSHQPAVSRFMGARGRRAIQQARRGLDRNHGRFDRRRARCATRRHRAVAGPEGDRRRLRDLRQSRIIFGYSTWMAYFAALGLLSLENGHIVLDRNGGKLVLAGITDRASRRTGHPLRDLAAVLEGAPKGAPVILLDHQPSDARHAAKLGVALQLPDIRTVVDPGDRPVGRARQCRLCLGPLRRRRDDAVREQRYRAVARLRAAARSPSELTRITLRPATGKGLMPRCRPDWARSSLISFSDFRPKFSTFSAFRLRTSAQVRRRS